MGLLAWLKRNVTGEKLVAKALVEFAEGDSKDALGDLVQGLIDLADGTKAEKPLLTIQSRLATFNLIPPLMASPATIPLSTGTPSATK